MSESWYDGGKQISMSDMDPEDNKKELTDSIVKSHKKWWLIVASIIGLIIVTLSIFFLWRIFTQGLNNSSNTANTSNRQNIVIAHVCNTQLVGEANAPLANSDQVALAGVVDKIVALKGYDSDPNCLYIALLYNIAAGNVSVSQDYMNKYSLVYDSGLGLSSAFTVPITPIDILKKNVDFLVQNSSQATANQKQDNTSLAQGSDAADKYYQGRK